MTNKDFFKQLTPFTKGYTTFFFVAIAGAIIANVITVIGPQQVQTITDTITQGLFSQIDMEKIGSIATTLLLLYSISAVLNYTQATIIATISQKLSQRLRSAITKKINMLPLKYFDTHALGDVLSRVTNDVDLAGQSLSQSLGTLVTSIILLVGSLWMMFATNWIMALSSIAAVAIGFIGSVILMIVSQKFFMQQQNNIAAMSGYVEEMYTGHSVVYSYNGMEQTKQTFDKLNNRLYHSMWKSQFISGIMMPIMQFIGNFAYVIVCIVGAALVIEKEITIGVIVAFMMYVRLFSQPLGQLSQAMTTLQSASAAMSRVFAFLNEEEMTDEATHQSVLENTKGHVVFEHVSFGYDDDKEIIHDFSAQAFPGQKVAIVGPTGAGKTTIVNLLMKFYEINKGHIYIDDVSIADLTREAVHEQFSMVLQDTWLFEGTIRENLLFNQKNVAEEQMIAAAKAASIHHFIMTLPKQYDTVLDDTVSLSVGQKQLLTIARAMLKNAPLLILDEATSSVDTRTEIFIQQAMDELMKGRTSFVIAHRLSTIKNADLILVMKDGNIIEQGTHDTLLAKQGFYANLYTSQFNEVD